MELLKLMPRVEEWAIAGRRKPTERFPNGRICDFECSGAGSCAGTTMNCGPDACSLTCNFTSDFELQDLDCDNSCDCDSSEC